MKLIEKYETLCNEIVIEFEKKQDLNFDFWIGDTIGEVAVFTNDYSFNLTDIVFDLKTNQPKEFIFQWLDDTIENYLKKNKKDIDYRSYCKGLRY